MTDDAERREARLTTRIGVRPRSAAVIALIVASLAVVAVVSTGGRKAPAGAGSQVGLVALVAGVAPDAFAAAGREAGNGACEHGSPCALAAAHHLRAERLAAAPDGIVLVEAQHMIAAAAELERANPAACVDLLGASGLAEAEAALSPTLVARRLDLARELFATPADPRAHIATDDEETAALDRAARAVARADGVTDDAFMQAALSTDERRACHAKAALMAQMLRSEPAIAAATVRRLYSDAIRAPDSAERTVASSSARR